MMKKLPAFLLFACSVSMLVNLYPALNGFGEHTFDSILLIYSTIAWFAYLFSLYFLIWKPKNRNSLVVLSIVLFIAILFPLYDVFLKSPKNFKQASGGLLPGLYVFMNYTSRISLLLFSTGILMRKELILRIAMISLALLIFISFTVTSYELIALIIRSESAAYFIRVSKILDPFAILFTFLLQMYPILNRRMVAEALKS